MSENQSIAVATQLFKTKSGQVKTLLNEETKYLKQEYDNIYNQMLKYERLIAEMKSQLTSQEKLIAELNL